MVLGNPGNYQFTATDPSRRYVRVAMLAILLAVFGSWAASQVAAAGFDYQRALAQPTAGEAIASAMGVRLPHDSILAHVYQPLSWITWEWRFAWRFDVQCHVGAMMHKRCSVPFTTAQRAYVGSVFARVHFVVFTGFLLAIIGGFWMNRATAGAAPRRTTHGSARWRTVEELIRSGLIVGYMAGWNLLSRYKIKQVGVVLGKVTFEKTGAAHQIRTDNTQPRGVLVLGPPGSGKSVCIFIPSLLQYNGSAIVYDPSFELFFTTSGAREQVLRNEIYLFAPTLADDNEFGLVSSCCNPIDWIRWGSQNEVGDLQTFSKFMLDPSDKASEGQEAHWIACGTSLAECVAAYLRYKDPERASYRGMYEFLADPRIGDDVDAAFQLMIDDVLDPGYQYGFTDSAGQRIPHHPHVWFSAAAMKKKPANEKGSIVSTLLRFLEPYRDPLLDRLTSRSSVTFEELLQRKMTWYFCVPEAAVSRLRFWVRPMLNFATIAQMREGAITFVGNLPVAKAKHELCIFADEARQLGPQEQWYTLLSAIRKYRIRFVLGFQDYGQIKEVAGQNEGLTAMTRYKVYFAPNKPETAEWISKSLGHTTATDDNLSFSGARVGFRTNVNASTNAHRKLLVEPDELMAMDENYAIMAETNNRPMIVERFYYLEDKELARRAAIPPPLRPPDLPADHAGRVLIPDPVRPGGKAMSNAERAVRARAAVAPVISSSGIPQRAGAAPPASAPDPRDRDESGTAPAAATAPPTAEPESDEGTTIAAAAAGLAAVAAATASLHAAPDLGSSDDVAAAVSDEEDDDALADLPELAPIAAGVGAEVGPGDGGGSMDVMDDFLALGAPTSVPAHSPAAAAPRAHADESEDEYVDDY